MKIKNIVNSQQNSFSILYLSHFGLREAPFKITPTTDFFYGGGRRGEILHALLYAINVGEGIMMVTGEVGSGKTMLLRTLIEKLPDNANVIYIANPSLSGREILYNICEELGLQAEASRPDTVRILQNYLIEQHATGRRVIAFIDEAQAMPSESLEELRLLSNLETSRDKLLQILIFGQPELEDKISQQNMRQLRERITIKMKLQPFGRDDVREYISTRLHAAGYNGSPMFSNDACRLIALISQGLSRRINVLADKSLLSAYERGGLTVNFADARRAAKDVNFGKMRYRSEQSRRFSKQLTIGVTVMACALLALAIGLRLFQESSPVTPAVAAEGEAVGTDTAIAATTEGATAEDTVIETTAEPATAQVTVTAGDDAVVPAPEDEMRSVIAGLNRGDGGILSGEDLAQQLAEHAEPHADESPQTSGGDPEWQPAADITPAIVNNERWSWMPASSYVRSRLNATQTWLQEGNQHHHYTARLLTVSQDRAVFLEKFLRYFADFYPIRNVMVYPLRLRNGNNRFVVTFGVYPTRDDAEVFISNVPYYFTGGRPFAQRLGESHAEAAKAWNPL